MTACEISEYEASCQLTVLLCDSMRDIWITLKNKRNREHFLQQFYDYFPVNNIFFQGIIFCYIYIHIIDEMGIIVCCTVYVLLYMQSVYACSLYMLYVYACSLYMQSVYACSLYMQSVYSCSLYMQSVYACSLYMQSTHGVCTCNLHMHALISHSMK